MKFVSVSLLPAVGLALSACAHTPAAPDTAIQAITLEQGPCFGFCPIYAVTLNANLSYTFNPTDFTRSEKPDAGRLTIPTPVEVYRDSVMYKYKDERIEELSLPQKQLLRLGPDNMRRVKAKLRDLKASLEDGSE